jgi:hypothetical protein
VSTEKWRPGRLAALGLAVTLIVSACGPDNDAPDPERPAAKATVEADGAPSAGAPSRPGPAATDPADPELLSEGKEGWRSCAKCHCATDPRIEEDRDWVAMNEETTCIASGDPAPRLRKSIIAYLRDADTLRPVLVDRSYRPEKERTTGKVLVPATGGSAYLRAERASIKEGAPSMVRLHWKATGEEKSMVVPAGRYDVVNFWFYRPGAENDAERWMLSGTNVSGCTSLDIGPEDEEILDVEPLVNAKFTAKPSEKGYALSLSLHDAGGSRMTLSRNGKVVMPGYRIVDADGNEVAEGRFGIT